MDAFVGWVLRMPQVVANILMSVDLINSRCAFLGTRRTASPGQLPLAEPDAPPLGALGELAPTAPEGVPPQRY